MQRSPYGTSLPGAGTVHHINRDWAGQAAGSSHVRNAPLATVGPKKAACRDGPQAAIVSIEHLVGPHH
jgi:hypothetical protein